VTRADARALLAAAEKKPEAAARVLAHALELREAIYRAFSALAGGRRVRADDLAVLDRVATEAAAHAHLIPHEGASAGRWPRPLSASSGAAVAGGALGRRPPHLRPDRGRARVCAGDVLLALPRPQQEPEARWCDMKICGNRSKARRHYARTKGSA
jgi:predicted RNA-binding Zn ribbon-like protein